MKINASPPTTYVVILLNLRSVAAFTVLAACRAVMTFVHYVGHSFVVATKETNCLDLENDHNYS